MGTTVTLDGVGNFDLAGNTPLTYTWSFIQNDWLRGCVAQGASDPLRIEAMDLLKQLT